MTAARTATLAQATVSEAEGVRYLHLGTPWVQGAMRLRRPARIELEYIQRMLAWMLWCPSESLAPPATPGHAVQLGLGAATITRFTCELLGMRTTAVEINASVIAACRMWFLLPPDNDRLHVLEMDARDWVLSAANQGSADVLCVDLYDQEAASPVLDDLAFYVGCHDALRAGGLMSVNLFGRNASFSRSAERIVAAFGADQVWLLRPTREGNTIVVAARSVALAERPVLLARAANIEDRFALPARKWLRLIRPWRAV